MQNLLGHYHPTLGPLATAMQRALHASAARTPLGLPVHAPRWRAVLARVSDESRPKFEDTLDTDLDWLLAEPDPAWVKANVTDVEAFRNTPAGELARERVGMRALYAPGTKRLIGGWLARNGWLFVFLLSSAAKGDLEQNRNAATEAIIATLLAMAHHDPHDIVGRPLLHVHALDRIIRSEQFAWPIYDALTRTYVRINAAGRPFDALAPSAKDEWTIIALGASKGRDDTARRFLLARLNKARAGNWPGTGDGLPRGFTPAAEPGPDGRLILDPLPKQQSVSRPVPDPRQRWEVQAVTVACLDPNNTTWAALARACGVAGLTSRGADEIGKPLHELKDLTSAGQLLITPAKIRAYCTGLLSHTETGVTPGQFNPGDGHRLEPRFPGDELGQVTYDIRVGRPEDHGWDWGVPATAWRDILLTFWLPDEFTPSGWSWEDDPRDWAWPQILDAARGPRPQATGRLASSHSVRPFSGMMRWSDATHRHLLHCIGTTVWDHDRYEWRREAHAESRRDAHGSVYRMSNTDGEAVCSWPLPEYHKAWADLGERLLTDLMADHPDATTLPTQHIAVPTDAGAEATRRQAATENRIAQLQHEVAARRADADALRLSAAHKRAAGDEAAATAYERQAEAAGAAAGRASAELDRERNSPLPVPAPHRKEPMADFGSPAAVIAALTGGFATGPAPRALHTGLRALGAEQTRLDLIDATTVRLTVTVTVRCPDGALASRTGHSLLRRSRPHLRGEKAQRLRQDAKTELARKWFHDGIDLATLAHLAGSSTEQALRIVREHLATGAPRAVGQGRMDELAAHRIPGMGLRAAITAHPVAAARAALWAALHPTDTPPTAQPTALPTGYPELIEATYRQAEQGWSRRSVMLDPRSDHRADALTILRAMPHPGVPVRTDHLAALMGVPVRYPNSLSVRTLRRKTAIPASLDRVDGWDGPGSANQPPQARTVALLSCPWQDCASATADALLLLPEIVIGTAASVVCRACLRPPTLNVRLPDSYRPLIPEHPRRGAWVHCSARSCSVDLGAGAGLMWRWDDTPPALPTTHPACTPAGRRQPTNSDIRLWAIGHGYDVADRGRIPAAVRRAYDTAHGSATPPTSVGPAETDAPVVMHGRSLSGPGSTVPS